MYLEAKSDRQAARRLLAAWWMILRLACGYPADGRCGWIASFPSWLPNQPIFSFLFFVFNLIRFQFFKSICCDKLKISLDNLDKNCKWFLDNTKQKGMKSLQNNNHICIWRISFQMLKFTSTGAVKFRVFISNFFMWIIHNPLQCAWRAFKRLRLTLFTRK